MHADRHERLAERRKGAGGSDVAGILGMSPWTTPYQVWLDKTGRAEIIDPPPEQAERMYWGTVLEDVIARHYATATGAKVQRINKQMHHPAVPIAIANVDRVIVAPGSVARWDDKQQKVAGAIGVLECKTAHALARNSAEWGEPGTSDVPTHYWLQCVWYAGITRLPKVDLAVLFGGQRFAVYTIQADDTLFNTLLGEVNDWWQKHVVADLPPDPANEDDARQRWQKHLAGKHKIVSAGVAEAVEKLRGVRAAQAQLEKDEEALRNVIVPAFEDAEAITFMGRPLATFKANKDSLKTDWQAAFNDARQALNLPVDHPAFVQAIVQNTVTKPGARVLRLATSKE